VKLALIEIYSLALLSILMVINDSIEALAQWIFCIQQEHSLSVIGTFPVNLNSGLGL